MPIPRVGWESTLKGVNPPPLPLKRKGVGKSNVRGKKFISKNAIKTERLRKIFQKLKFFENFSRKSFVKKYRQKISWKRLGTSHQFGATNNTLFQKEVRKIYRWKLNDDKKMFNWSQVYKKKITLYSQIASIWGMFQYHQLLGIITWYLEFLPRKMRFISLFHVESTKFQMPTRECFWWPIPILLQKSDSDT